MPDRKSQPVLIPGGFDRVQTAWIPPVTSELASGAGDLDRSVGRATLFRSEAQNMCVPTTHPVRAENSSAQLRRRVGTRG